MTESDWGRLPGEQRLIETRRLALELHDRHTALMLGQEQIGERLTAHGRAISENAVATTVLGQRVDTLHRDVGVNTALTQLVKSDTQQIVDAFQAAKTTFKAVDWMSRTLTRFVLPAGVVYGVYKAGVTAFDHISWPSWWPWH